MQISRCLLVLCAAFCALSVRGDNEAQRKAREALERYVQSAPSQPAPTTPAAPATPAPTKRIPAPKIPPAAPAAVPVAPSVPAAESDAIAKAREALRQKMQTLTGETAPVTTAAQPVAPAPATPAAPAATPAPAAVPAPAVVAQPVATPPPAIPVGADPATIAKAREALRQKMQTLTGETAPVTTAAQPVASAPAVSAAPAATPAPAAVPDPAVAAQPVATPPPTIPVGADPATIAKAREAMRQKMQEVVAQEPAAAPAAPTAPVQAATPPAPAAPPAAAPTTTPPAAVPPVAAAPPAAAPGPDVTAKAREALRQKMQELTVTPAAPATPPFTAPTAAAPAATAAAPAAAQPAPTFPPGADEQSIAKARDAMRTKMQDVAAQPLPDTANAISEAKAREKAEESAESRKARVAGFNKNPNFPKLEGPPLPITPEKQQQLANLLQKYKADQITPEEYHAERAKILSGQ